MEGRDGAHAFDFVNMAAGLGERFAEQRLGRAVAEQQQPLGLGERDVLARDLGASLALAPCVMRTPGELKQEREAL